MIQRKRFLLLFLLMLFTGLLSNTLLLGGKTEHTKAIGQRMEEFRDFNICPEKIKEYQTQSRSTKGFVKILTWNMLYHNLIIEKHSKNLGGGGWFQFLMPNKIWDEYYFAYATLFIDAECFPVPNDSSGHSNISYDNSWGQVRSYGGKRSHEGCDILAGNNKAGYFPVQSVSDGKIENIGWLTLGGYRVGIRSKHGAYYYYAHLDSYVKDLKKGEEVKAGQIIGYMGNTGYGEEGTKGQFDVHLHFGVYLDFDGEQLSVNPFPVLKYLEPYRKVFYPNNKM